MNKQSNLILFKPMTSLEKKLKQSTLCKYITQVISLTCQMKQGQDKHQILILILEQLSVDTKILLTRVNRTFRNLVLSRALWHCIALPKGNNHVSSMPRIMGVLLSLILPAIGGKWGVLIQLDSVSAFQANHFFDSIHLSQMARLVLNLKYLDLSRYLLSCNYQFASQ